MLRSLLSLSLRLPYLCRLQSALLLIRQQIIGWVPSLGSANVRESDDGLR